MSFRLHVIWLYLPLCSCVFLGQHYNPDRLNAEKIESILIKRTTNEGSSLYLNKRKINEFVITWNKLYRKGPCKFITKILLIVEDTRGVRTEFMLGSGVIKNNRNHICHNIEVEYFQSLSEKLNDI